MKRSLSLSVVKRTAFTSLISCKLSLISKYSSVIKISYLLPSSGSNCSFQSFSMAKYIGSSWDNIDNMKLSASSLKYLSPVGVLQEAHNKPIQKTMVLRTFDRAWVNQIDVMSKLREGIHLRSYAQNNPLEAYVEEGYELFEEMMNTISNDVVTFCNNLKIVIKEQQ